MLSDIYITQKYINYKKQQQTKELNKFLRPITTKVIS